MRRALPKAKVIIVVEDDTSMGRAIGRILRLGGFASEIFSSAEAALASDTVSADCLIVDIHLPGMSGFELYQQLALHEDMPPTVFITAHDEPAIRLEAMRMGAAGYLPKPFRGRTLLDAIHMAICSR
jgi:FixJ family two-component response regulator